MHGHVFCIYKHAKLPTVRAHVTQMYPAVPAVLYTHLSRCTHRFCLLTSHSCESGRLYKHSAYILHAGSCTRTHHAVQCAHSAQHLRVGWLCRHQPPRGQTIHPVSGSMHQIPVPTDMAGVYKLLTTHVCLAVAAVRNSTPRERTTDVQMGLQRCLQQLLHANS
jgi:hypothetical protein